MCVLKRDISFPSDSKLTQPLPRYQFKFRIRTDYFGLVVINFRKEKNSLKTYQGLSKQQEVEEMRFSEAEIEEQERKEETGGVVRLL